MADRSLPPVGNARGFAVTEPRFGRHSGRSFARLVEERPSHVWRQGVSTALVLPCLRSGSSPRLNEFLAAMPRSGQIVRKLKVIWFLPVCPSLWRLLPE